MLTPQQQLYFESVTLQLLSLHYYFDDDFAGNNIGNRKPSWIFTVLLFLFIIKGRYCLLRFV